MKYKRIKIAMEEKGMNIKRIYLPLDDVSKGFRKTHSHKNKHKNFNESLNTCSFHKPIFIVHV